jgi:gluconolactonase
MIPASLLPLLVGMTMQSADLGRIERLDPALDRLLPAGARLERLADGFQFLEGPVWMPEGFLVFSDIPGNRLHKWSAEKGAEVFRDAAPGMRVHSNGNTLDPQGRLVTMEHGTRRITRTEEDGSIAVLAERFEGKRLNSPNDGAYGPGGILYFTDPPYGLAKGDEDPAKELPFNGVYLLRPDGRVELLEKGLERPNGIAVTPDGKRLIVANSDSKRRLWMSYPLLPDGRLGEGRVFADASQEKESGSPDGLRFDERGNLWATGPGGCRIYDGQGKLLGNLRLPEQPANLCFGGPKGQTLFLTARSGLYRIETSVRGAGRL